MDLYNDDTLIQNVSLQSTSIDDNYHLSFIHDGDGGGNYVISNIPKIVNEKSVTKCKVRVKGVAFYSDVASTDIVFDTTEAIPYVNLKLAPKTISLNINVQVRGEDDSTSSFVVKVSGCI